MRPGRDRCCLHFPGLLDDRAIQDTVLQSPNFRCVGAVLTNGDPVIVLGQMIDLPAVADNVGAGIGLGHQHQCGAQRTGIGRPGDHHQTRGGLVPDAVDMDAGIAF
jgi:hypothetical protein